MTNGVRHMAGRGEVNSNHVWTDAVDSQLCIWTGFSDQSDDLNIQKLPQSNVFLLAGSVFRQLEGSKWRDVYLSSSISSGCPKTQIVPAITAEMARIPRSIAHQCACK